MHSVNTSGAGLNKSNVQLDDSLIGHIDSQLGDSAGSVDAERNVLFSENQSQNQLLLASNVKQLNNDKEATNSGAILVSKHSDIGSDDFKGKTFSSMRTTTKVNAGGVTFGIVEKNDSI